MKTRTRTQWLEAWRNARLRKSPAGPLGLAAATLLTERRLKARMDALSLLITNAPAR